MNLYKISRTDNCEWQYIMAKNISEAVRIWMKVLSTKCEPAIVEELSCCVYTAKWTI